MELLTWLEASLLGQAVRGAGVWSYAVINLVHILGVATLFGSVLVLDLKLMGLFPRAALGTLSVPSVPLFALVHRSSAWRARGTNAFSRRQRIQLAVGGAVSFLAWTTAVTAGRMLGYW